MKTYSAREIIKKEYGSSRNFITPKVLGYGKINKNMAYELSSGSGIYGGTIYGVSVVKLIKGGKTQRMHDLSSSFKSKYKAKEYIEYLKIKYKRG